MRALEWIKLPASLRHVDLSYCSSLQRLEIGTDGAALSRSLVFLNLDGCRELAECSQPTQAAFCGVQELNLGYCVKIGAPWIHTALRFCGESLLTVQLRGVASDTALACLCEACPNLRTSDFSFSRGVTDAGLEMLVESCGQLERCNVRACPNVSRALYNRLPQLLSRRSRPGGLATLEHGFFYLKN